MKFQIYKDRKKEWRWRLKAVNGRIVASSGEGYKRKGAMLNTIYAIASLRMRGIYEIVEGK